MVFHCLAGVHRAALAFCLCLMFYLGTSFKVACTILESLRDVDLRGIVNQGRLQDSDKEDHMLYIPDWESDAYHSTIYRVHDKTQVVARMVPISGS